MKRILLLAALGLSSGFSGCGTNGSHETRGSAGLEANSASIVGTVLDASTGETVANAHVEGPAGRTTRSDARGRFEFQDLQLGTEGEVKASTDDGRKARVALRRLGPGRLEIVLQLTAR